jgi:hypothetical protein
LDELLEDWGLLAVEDSFFLCFAWIVFPFEEEAKNAGQKHM